MVLTFGRPSLGKPRRGAGVRSSTADFCGARLCDERKFVSRFHPIQIILLVILLVAPASALAAGASRIDVKVTGDCVGDTISGRVAVRARPGSRFTLRLLKQQAVASRWTTTKLSRSFRSRSKRGTYRFRFNVSAFDAYAYRLGVYHSQRRTLSRPIAAASCAPGLQVPEARFALLLPLSLLATASVLLVRRRTHR
jgi:hypothetical protein